jgi:hypothetical protein
MVCMSVLGLKPTYASSVAKSPVKAEVGPSPGAARYALMLGTEYSLGAYFGETD